MYNLNTSYMHRTFVRLGGDLKRTHSATKTQRPEESSVNFKALTGHEESIAKKVVNSAFNVHRELGPGLLEKIYETCFCHEISKQK